MRTYQDTYRNKGLPLQRPVNIILLVQQSLVKDLLMQKPD